MLEIARNFEQTATNLKPVLLIGPGLACVIVGLFVWLGGLGLRKLLVAIVGAIGGGIFGFSIAGQNILPAVVAAGLGAVIAVIFEKAFITIMAAGLAAVFGFAVLAEIYKTDFSNGLKHACSQMPWHSWPIIAALIIILIVAGFYLWRLTSALCCAALGTMLVFAGMILLLLYKGSAPVRGICSRTSFCAGVFLAMTALGTVEQLLLCRPPHSHSVTKKQTDKDKQEPEETPPSWRTQ